MFSMKFGRVLWWCHYWGLDSTTDSTTDCITVVSMCTKPSNPRQRSRQIRLTSWDRERFLTQSRRDWDETLTDSEITSSQLVHCRAVLFEINLVYVELGIAVELINRIIHFNCISNSKRRKFVSNKCSILLAKWTLMYYHLLMNTNWSNPYWIQTNGVTMWRRSGIYQLAFPLAIEIPRTWILLQASLSHRRITRKKKNNYL